jgi:hypothetical protein
MVEVAVCGVPVEGDESTAELMAIAIRGMSEQAAEQAAAKDEEIARLGTVIVGLRSQITARNAAITAIRRLCDGSRAFDAGGEAVYVVDVTEALGEFWDGCW